MAEYMSRHTVYSSDLKPEKDRFLHGVRDQRRIDPAEREIAGNQVLRIDRASD